jgi:glycosyltransferase involved in cell wall biosynthesis
MGRIGVGKNIDKLVTLFRKRWDEGETDLRLTLAGALDANFHLPKHPAIDYRGYVSEEEKRRLMAAAKFIVNPAELESLSMLVVEAIMMNKPVLVNGESPVLRNYADNLSTVETFEVTEGFELNTQGFAALTADDFANSKRWLKQHFSWDNVSNDLSD